MDSKNEVEVKPRDPSSFDVTGAEFTKYLHSYTQNAKCALCGHEGPLTAAKESDSQITYMVGTPFLAPKNIGFMGFCVAICDSCGQASFFDSFKVIKWVVEMREAEHHHE